MPPRTAWGRWLSNGVIIDDLVEVSSNYGIYLNGEMEWSHLLQMERWREVARIVEGHFDIEPGRLVAALEIAKQIDRHELIDEATCGPGWPDGIEGPISLEKFKEIIAIREIKRANRNAKVTFTSIRRREFGTSRALLVLRMLDSGRLYKCAAPSCVETTDLTVDHKVPLSRGGSDDIDNLQFLCRRHNSAKGDRPE